MTDLEVYIEELKPMLMASAYGFGESPELTALQKMEKFARSKGLIKGDKIYFRHFGFNNPCPSTGSPNYGYEVWITIPPDIQPESDIRIIQYPGGLYAVTKIVGVSKISDIWRKLVIWGENSHYRLAHHQYLEELLNPLEPDIEKFIFKLYLPIIE